MIQYNNFLIKREQSRAGSRFAECEKSRLKAKILITLALLLTAATGARAQSNGTYSDLVEEIGFGGDKTLSHDYYKYESGLTIEITRSGVIDGNGAIIDMEGAIISHVFCISADNVTIKNLSIINYTGIGDAIYFFGSGVSLINIGYDVALNRVTTANTWTLSMPGSDVVLTPIYAKTAAFATTGSGSEVTTLLPAAAEGAVAGTDAPLIAEGTGIVAFAGTSTEVTQGTVMYAVTAATATAAPALTSSEWKTTVPTAKTIADEGTEVKVWYYIQGADAPEGVDATLDNTFNNSDVCTTPLTVTVLSNKFDLTLNAANANTIDVTQASKGTVSVKEGTGAAVDKTANIANGKLTGIKMGSDVKLNTKQGYKFRSVKAAEEKPIAINPTTDAAEEGSTFTESSFTMPTSDVTVDYEIVRDLSYETTANVIIGTGAEATTATSDTRLRIRKDGDKGYVFVNALAISFSDNLEGVVITKDGFETAKLVPQFYIQQDDAQNPWIPVTDANLDDETGLPNNLQPGQVYCVTFVPGEGSAYDGETPQSVTITLFEGYPVEVAAKEFVTYYREDDNLTVDENSGAQLYTITSVGETTATATEIPSANKEMPFLIYNNSDETQTFVLIPTDDQINQTHAIEFVGTAEATIISASNSDWTNYAFNGKSFVWVKNPVSIAANKAWLSIPTAKNVRAITLVFEEENETGINNVNDNVNVNYNDSWYDLNGRKLPEAPKRRGVFIVNGKKVVIK